MGGQARGRPSLTSEDWRSIIDQYVRLRDLERPDFLREARQLIAGDVDPRYVGLTCERLAR